MGTSLCWSMGLDGVRWEPAFAGAWVWMGRIGNQSLLEHGFTWGVMGTRFCWSMGLDGACREQVFAGAWV